MKKYNFKISINDGYVEWIYDLKVDGKTSIDSLMREICKMKKTKFKEGKLRLFNEGKKI